MVCIFFKAFLSHCFQFYFCLSEIFCSAEYLKNKFFSPTNINFSIFLSTYVTDEQKMFPVTTLDLPSFCTYLLTLS